jgi:hypothetical protein
LTSTGDGDVLVAKWSSATSSFTWAQRAAGPNGDVARALVVSWSSVYVAGYFGNASQVENLTASFGPTTLTSDGLVDVFVAKLTDAGSTSRFFLLIVFLL